MTLTHKIAGGTAAAVLLFGAVAASAYAQQPPFSAYGTGVSAGATVEAFVGGVSCGTTTADAQGQWLLQIEPDAPCNPTAGAAITFTLNGAPTTGTATWQAGGAPADPAAGISLQVAAATPTPTAPTVTPPDTGNAGLVASPASSSTTWLMLLIGAGVATFVAGARIVTRSR